MYGTRKHSLISMCSEETFPLSLFLSFLSLPVSLLPHKLLTCWFIPGKPYSEFGRVHKDLGYVSQTWVMCERKWKLLSHVQLFATPWTTVHGILQARILEWVAFPFSRGSSQPRDQTQVSHITGRFFTSWATREAWLLALTSALLV